MPGSRHAVQIQAKTKPGRSLWDLTQSGVAVEKATDIGILANFAVFVERKVKDSETEF
jgi:hypothetical protein